MLCVAPTLVNVACHPCRYSSATRSDSLCCRTAICCFKLILALLHQRLIYDTRPVGMNVSSIRKGKVVRLLLRWCWCCCCVNNRLIGLSAAACCLPLDAPVLSFFAILFVKKKKKSHVVGCGQLSDPPECHERRHAQLAATRDAVRGGVCFGRILRGKVWFVMLL